MHSSVPSEDESKSGMTRPTEEKLRQNHEVEKGLRVGGDVGGASANASTRSLAGSGTSLLEGGDTSCGYPQTSLPEAPGPSSRTAEKEDVGSAETGEIGVEKSPHLGQIHMSGPPVTTGREYPLSLDEEGNALLAEGPEENIDSTHGHMMKGKARQSKGAPITSAGPGPHPGATGALPSSTQTSPTTTSQEPTPLAADPEGTTTSDIPLAHKTDAPPKKSKHGFFEKLKIKFEGKERPKGKN
jgi:hypothetical protein